MASKQKPSFDWALFAWQGVQMDVPDTWNLGLVSGTYRRGHCRLDDDEVARVEVQWERGRSRVDLEALVREHVARLESAARKKKVPFRSKRDAHVARPQDMEAVAFEWQSDFHALNLLAFCPECKRVTLVRVMERPGERLRPVAARVFESLRDHGREGVTPWAVYGFRFAVPKQYVLDESKLNLQRIELAFRGGGEAAWVARSNLAEMQLRDKSLKEWLDANHRKELRQFALETEEETYRGHACVRFSGRSRLSRIQKVFGRGLQLEGRLWRCEDSDKLFLARRLGRQEDRAGFDDLCNGIQCHDRPQA